MSMPLFRIDKIRNHQTGEHTVKLTEIHGCAVAVNEDITAYELQATQTLQFESSVSFQGKSAIVGLEPYLLFHNKTTRLCSLPSRFASKEDAMKVLTDTGEWQEWAAIPRFKADVTEYEMRDEGAKELDLSVDTFEALRAGRDEAELAEKMKASIGARIVTTYKSGDAMYTLADHGSHAGIPSLDC